MGTVFEDDNHSTQRGTPMPDGHTPTPQFSRRRAALRAFGGAGALLLGASAMAQGTGNPSRKVPSCVLTPAQTEGPYFVDERLERSDVRSDPASGAIKPGALLTLNLAIFVVDGARCAPASGMIVDVWHCDAAGVYSDVNDARLGTRGSRFLRGYQVTGADGRVRFTTIYPGAYPGRAVHVHFKVRAKASRRDVEFTSQLYFDDALTDRVHAVAPYAGSPERRTRNADDGLYRRGGRELQLDVVDAGGGYAAAYDVGIRA
jgi:protocatechuate 3,4-dioxygenase beta subunit